VKVANSAYTLAILDEKRVGQLANSPELATSLPAVRTTQLDIPPRPVTLGEWPTS